jgi:hypothetical protein
VLVVVGGPLVGLLTDARWFESLGAGALYWQRLQLQGGLFVGGTLAALALLMLSLLVAGLISRRLGGASTSAGTPREPRTPLMDDRGNLRPEGILDSLRSIFGSDADGAVRSAGAMIGNGALRIGAVVIALLIGAQVAANWQQIALWQNAVPYVADGTAVDPIFGRDISFYLFSLPVLRLAQGLGILLLAGATALAALRYLPALGARGLGGVGTLPRLHLALLLGGLLLVTAYGYQLDKLDLVYSQNGVATGVDSSSVSGSAGSVGSSLAPPMSRSPVKLGMYVSRICCTGIKSSITSLINSLKRSAILIRRSWSDILSTTTYGSSYRLLAAAM